MNLNGCEVCKVQVDFDAGGRAFFSGAVWVDGPFDGDELGEEELDALGATYPEELAEAEALQRQRDLAEDWYKRQLDEEDFL